MQTQVSSLTSPLDIGVVTLNVSDLQLMKYFYFDLAGFEVLSQDTTRVVLGYHHRPSIHLTHTPHLAKAPVTSAGLYHTAILYEQRSSLAHALARIGKAQPILYGGSAYHKVSEAFYFSDPEGNSVELYHDTNPSTWEWHNGMIVMGSEPLDPNKYIDTYSSSAPAGSMKVGHIHLKVGDIEKAQIFYSKVLGLHITAHMPTALFLSDGVYHHHLGMNTWESLGTGKRTESLGLRSFELLIKKSDSAALKTRLNKAGVAYKEQKGSLIIEDPWGTVIHIT